ncbi:MAG: D-aminoacyl-tRNA deacylase [Bacteroidota bacterium]|jgi:D-tyrosyl-tRNA(Tyr) deacylase
MRAVIQRVSKASVTIEEKIHAHIGTGLLVLVGFEGSDNEEDLDWMVSKIVNMRIFPDEFGKMNKSVKDVEGEILLVSQFTLFASVKKGNRPSFIQAANPETASKLFQRFYQIIQSEAINEVKVGVFGAHMMVNLLNDGPVTIIADSKNKY